MISCCSCFGTKTTSKDEGITIGDKEDPIILQPKVSVKVSIIHSSYFNSPKPWRVLIPSFHLSSFRIF